AARRTADEPAEDALVFDFAGRKLARTRDGWKAAAPEREGWEVERVAAKKDTSGRVVQWTLVARSGTGSEKTIPFREHQQITAWAVRPARPPFKAALLAVAYHEQGVPTLALYNADSG